MRLPIETTTVKFAAAGPAKPVLDFETSRPKTDENRVPLLNVPPLPPDLASRTPSPSRWLDGQGAGLRT